MIIRVAVLAGLLAVGCRQTPDGREQAPSPEALPFFVGKIWAAVDASAAPGTLRIFLPDGTLLMDSCGETYRLSRWQAVDDRRIEWEEDGARIAADVTQVGSDQLDLRLHLIGEIKEERYRLAQVPYVCPDL